MGGDCQEEDRQRGGDLEWAVSAHLRQQLGRDPEPGEALLRAAGKSPKLKELGTKVEDAIKDAKKCIDKYRKVGTTTTYDDYSTMPVNGLVDGRECVVKQGYAVMQALVDLAKEVGVFDDCSPFHHNSVYTYRHEGEHPKGETGGV